MTRDEWRAKRLRYHLYDSCEGIREHAERIVDLEELVADFLYEHEDYIAEGNYLIGDLDLEHAMHHNQAVFRRQAKALGIEAWHD